MNHGRVRISGEKSIRNKISKKCHPPWLGDEEIFRPRSSKWAYKWGWFDLFSLLKTSDSVCAVYLTPIVVIQKCVSTVKDSVKAESLKN